jgi:hypothetical protein
MAHHRRILILILSAFALVYLFFALHQILEPKQVVTEQDQRSDRRVETYFAGTGQDVTVYTLTGPQKGPTLLIIAGIHGDEKGGYLSAARFTDLQMQRGTLIIVPRLNRTAIERGKRQGLDGDMNRLFHLPDDSDSLRDSKVVNLVKSLIKKADCVLNLHQGDGFYSPRWISKKRNPLKWGQCNVIDAPTFDLPNGERLELERFAQAVAERSNRRIADKQYHFQVNNTNTGETESRHKEQRMSLTYYALSRQHKLALGLEATKNCSLPEAVSFLTVVVHSVMDEMGVSAALPPSDALSSTRGEMAENRRT